MSLPRPQVGKLKVLLVPSPGCPVHSQLGVWRPPVGIILPCQLVPWKSLPPTHSPGLAWESQTLSGIGAGAGICDSCYCLGISLPRLWGCSFLPAATPWICPCLGTEVEVQARPCCPGSSTQQGLRLAYCSCTPASSSSPSCHCCSHRQGSIPDDSSHSGLHTCGSRAHSPPGAP